MARQLDIDASGAPTVTGTTWGLPDANRREWLYDVEQFSGEYLADGTPIWRKTITHSLAGQTAGQYEVQIPTGLSTPLTFLRMEAFLTRSDGTNIKPLPWLGVNGVDGTPNTADNANLHFSQATGAPGVVLRLSNPTGWTDYEVRATIWYAKG
jgi:hypothetical protein